MKSFSSTLHQANSWLLVFLAFCLPLSTSGITISVVLLLLCWLLEGRFLQKFEEIRTNPLCIAVVIYFALLLIGLCWTSRLDAGLEAIEKQWKILLLPVFLTCVQWRHRWRYLGAFIAGVTVVMASTYLAWFDLLHFADVSPEHLTKKTSHVVYNPMLAFALYLLVHELIWGKLEGWKRWSVFGLVSLMFFDMFITEGRAGQLAFFVLLGVLLIQYFRRSVWKAIVVVALALPLVFAAGYYGSAVFRGRIDQARYEIQTFNRNPGTSVGLRLLYWKNSWRIIKKSPLVGVGTGDFRRQYAWHNLLFSSNMPYTDNPHNQYILTTVQLGALGLLSLLGMFAIQIWQALRNDDGWQRIRLAFPILFLTIMLTESYLVVYETGFLFTVVGAVLSKRRTKEKENKTSAQRISRTKRTDKRYWLILSYRTNVPGSACSQHLDDRLPYLRAAGIRPILLSGPVGARSEQELHYRSWSLAPSGIRFELRHFLRKHCKRRWQFKLVESLLLLPVYPFYLLEKILINLESEWSWWFTATLRGMLLQKQYQPELVYSTGGSASAHMAGLLIRRFSGRPWLAEVQDPLVHDQEWTRGTLVLNLYRWLEKQIAAHCSTFLFLTEQAMNNARQRVGPPFPGRVVRPGAAPEPFGHVPYFKNKYCSFAHFGSLAGSRNLVVFFQALDVYVQEHPEHRNKIRVDLFGSLDHSSLQAVKRLGLASMIKHHGLVPRSVAQDEMQRADCLLLIQNLSFFSSETIPSKVYEYLLSGRPILGLVYNNIELTGLLSQRGHYIAPADDPLQVKKEITRIMACYEHSDFTFTLSGSRLLLEDAVGQLIALGKEAIAKQEGRAHDQPIAAEVHSAEDEPK